MGGLHGSCCVTVTLMPFLALTAVQSSCNPRSFIHNSGCGSHWRQGGGGVEGLWASLPPGGVGAGTPGRGKVGSWESTLSSLPSPLPCPLAPFPFSHIPSLSPTSHTSLQPFQALPQDHSYTLGSPMHAWGQHSVSEVDWGSSATM